MYNLRDLDRQREAMLSTPKPLVPVFAAALLLTGCAPDMVAVNRYKLQGLNEALASQQADLTHLKAINTSHHDELKDLNQHSTDRILEAITLQVKPPECPPIPETPVCKVSETDTGTSDRVKGKLVVGEVEKAFLIGPNIVYDARIDSGAETSSMDARDVRRFERDGKEWVRFEIPVPGSETEQTVTLERQVVRNVRIIQANQEDYERRAVVELQFRIGDHQQKAEFTLSDRDHLTYSLLIGRNILRDVMLIDVGKEFSTELPRSITSAANGKN
ncbi:Uncharacterized conserved protein [Marinobacter daqiaonensis]|uniref:Uncharacterized conserved protein n=1 Tax=Marinobacter daqiaonensis TaxID=650891 RepID=A0A1I6JDR8_9GAMM|nr:RimK/LysX family protein [Marinobacter daqiaonensis]SFR77108.1 Uncharacterized conserved protein [Marinobacter daqiaonensis]